MRPGLVQAHHKFTPTLRQPAIEMKSSYGERVSDSTKSMRNSTDDLIAIRAYVMHAETAILESKMDLVPLYFLEKM